MPTVPSSQTVTPLSDSWKQWIRTNVERGCTINSMVDAMAKSGINREIAEAHILYEQALINSGVKTPIEICYKPRASSLTADSVIDIEGHRIHVMLRMKRPLITVLDNVLTPKECEDLIAQSEARLTRNQVVDPNSDKRIEIKERTSFGTFWHHDQTELITRIDRRIELLTNHPITHGEGLQVMRYEPGGEYKAHFDYFPPEKKGSATHLARGGQRIATLLMYLNAPTEGGETEFPDAGITIVPKQGSAVYFEYMDAEGNLDAMTLHAGLPVKAGVKWIATRWIRERAL